MSEKEVRGQKSEVTGKRFRIKWEHREGDGMMTVATGRASGIYEETIGADDVWDATITFEACHRHGDRLLSVEEVAA